MSQHKRPLLPFDALMVKSGLDQATTNFGNGGRGGTYEIAAGQTYLAELLGQSVRNISRWAKDGVPLRGAELACDVLGLHPCEVWGDEWIDCVLSVESA